MSRVFANDPGNWGSIPGRVIPKTEKMALDATLFKSQHYKVRIKGKVEQSRERSSTLHYISVKREPSVSLDYDRQLSYLSFPTLKVHVIGDHSILN